MVHDGARPCLDQALLERGLAAARETGAAAAGMPVKDTIKTVSASHLVTGTPPRESLWAAQTPQIFRYELLRQAHGHCTETMTDDAAMVESLGHPVKMFPGYYENLKVTTPGDLVFIESFLESFLESFPGESFPGESFPGESSPGESSPGPFLESPLGDKNPGSVPLG
jgi:2-C-methyl-D-erythritol 4-phosphate cytidylyltransferase